MKSKPALYLRYNGKLIDVGGGGEGATPETYKSINHYKCCFSG